MTPQVVPFGDLIIPGFQELRNRDFGYKQMRLMTIAALNHANIDTTDLYNRLNDEKFPSFHFPHDGQWSSFELQTSGKEVAC